MRSCSLLLVLLLPLTATSLSAQRQKATFDFTTPEGRLLQLVGEESDDAKKVALMEQFLAQYPKHDGATWVYGQMVATCSKLGQFDKAIATAEKALAQDPTDLDIAFGAVKAAEGKKDSDAVRKWTVQSSDMARKSIQTPKTADEDDDAFKQRIDFAKQLEAYAEYALYASALQAPQPPQKAEALKALEAHWPESKYLAQGYGLWFSALVQGNDMPAAVTLAERLIAKGQGSEAMLATAADFYVRQNKEPEKVLDYSSKLLQLLDKNPKPDGLSDADWQKRKEYLTGWGQWMTGVVYCSQGKFADANKVLRVALPLVESNAEMKAGALYNLGIANTRLRNVPDAVKFFEQCISIPGPYQPVCTDNLKGIRATYRVVK